MSTIFIFSNTLDGLAGYCYALTDNGVILNSKYCSNQKFALADLNDHKANSHYRLYFRETRYKVEFIRADRLEAHEEFQKALAKFLSRLDSPEYLSNWHIPHITKKGDKVNA
jgi:hypothetical protein